MNRKYFQDLMEFGRTTREGRLAVLTANVLPDWQQAAEEGDAEAQYQLWQYFCQMPNDREAEAAKRYLSMAAEQGHPQACRALDRLREEGGRLPEPDERFDYIFHCGWAEMYDAACGIIEERREEDAYLAIMLLRELAEGEDALAQVALGHCYGLGFGVEQDDVLAAMWYRVAAERRKPYALFHVGRIYYEGRGVEQDYGKAVEWFRKAAELDDGWARVYLGHCYCQGHGVERDEGQAELWYSQAARQHSWEGEAAEAAAADCLEKLLARRAERERCRREEAELAWEPEEPGTEMP